MLKKSKKGYWFLPGFKKDDLIHGFSSRKFGTMMVKKTLSGNRNLEKFLKLFGINNKDLVMMEQVHKDRIRFVQNGDGGKVIAGVDGLVSNKQELALGIKTADCLPIIFYDPVARIIGACHAGWRGIAKRLPQKMIDLMIKKGCSPLNILVGIGPFIGGCCYLVDRARADTFRNIFGNLKRMFWQDKNGYHLELLVPTESQLLGSGILQNNIRTGSVCNSCQIDEFFSYRKDSLKTYGEMLSIIGFKNS